MCANYSLLAGVVFGSLFVCDFESLFVSVFVSVFVSLVLVVFSLVELDELVESVAVPESVAVLVPEPEPAPDLEPEALSFL